MKTIYRIIFFAVIAVLSACDPAKVDTPSPAATELDYFKNLNEFRTINTGMYSKVYDDYLWRNVDAGYTNLGIYCLWTLPGDDITETNGTRTAYELFDGLLSPTDYRIQFTFDKTYEMIARAHIILDKVATVDFSGYQGAAEIAGMEGEALFFRAYGYFKLFNIYGNVPLVLGRVATQAEANKPVSDKLEVLDQVIEDLRGAVSALPDSWPPEFAGRIFKNSARGLLIKALVFRGNYTGSTADYTEAINVFGDMTPVLLADYLTNFDAFNENNAESLYEVQAAQGGIDNYHLYNDGGWRGVETLSIWRGPNSPNSVGSPAANANTKMLITNKLMNNFGTDPRISVFINTVDGVGGRMFRKYTLDGYDAYSTSRNSLNNERVLRYADVILLVAEAKLKTGNLPGAIGHINEIRTRARNWGGSSGNGDGINPADMSVAETNTSTIMQWIMDERFVELAGEGHRWWDLKRWHESGDINLSGWTGGDTHFSTNLSSASQFDVNKHLLFPIPQIEVDRNSGITSNNPGY